MADSKRVSLTLKDRYTLVKALQALEDKSVSEKSYVADMGRSELNKIKQKLLGKPTN